MKKKLLPIALAGAAYAGISFLAFYEVTNRNARLPKYAINGFNKKHNIGVEQKDERVEWFRSQELEEFEIPNGRGQLLKALFLPTEKPSDKFFICSHGYRSRGRGEFRHIAKFLHDQGINALFVDHQSCGDSEGKYISFGKHESADLMLWVEFMLDKFGKDIQLALYGISLGSATVMLLSNNENLPENVKFIVADCGFTTVNEQFSFVLKSLSIPDKPLLKGANVFSKALGKWDFDEVNPIESVREAKVPMLFIHGENDDFVPTFMACRLYNACPTEKDFLTVPGAGHAESYQKNSELYEEKVSKFIKKYFK